MAQVDLWIRFVEKLIDQTKIGVLKWDMRYSGEYARFATCVVRDRTVWFWTDKSKRIELVGGNRVRWTILVPDLLRFELLTAIGDQLNPAAMADAQQFARDFLED